MESCIRSPSPTLREYPKNGAPAANKNCHVQRCLASIVEDEDGTNLNKKNHDHNPIGVIFDMDGVLVDSADAHLMSWKQMAEEHGLSVSESQVTDTFGRQNRDIIPILFGDVSPTRLQTLSDRKEEIYRELVRGKAPVVDGAVALVLSLADCGAKLAIGSSAPRANIDLVLSEMSLAECFDAIVSGDEVTRGKPNPEVFAMACQRLRMEPSCCVVIEDAPAGVTAAVRAGALGVAVAIYHPRSAFDGAALTVDRLSDLSADDLYRLVSARK